MNDFSDLNERIQVGRTLYSILFGYLDVWWGAWSFAQHRTHTGSRQDYWNSLFHHDAHKPASRQLKLKGMRLLDQRYALYSPKLIDAWEDAPLSLNSNADWWEGQHTSAYFTPFSLPKKYDMSKNYAKLLHELDLGMAFRAKWFE